MQLYCGLMASVWYLRHEVMSAQVVIDHYCFGGYMYGYRRNMQELIST